MKIVKLQFIFADHLAEIFPFVAEENAFLQLRCKSSSVDSRQNLIDMGYVLLEIIRVNFDVVHTDETSVSLNHCRDDVLRTLVASRCVC